MTLKNPLPPPTDSIADFAKSPVPLCRKNRGQPGEKRSLPPISRLPCFLGLLAALLFQTWFFSLKFTSPWVDMIDFNGAVWSQSGHNLLKAGLEATAGVPSPFFFGSMPIPPEDYYVHHPALLSLIVGGLFRVFGEHEWVARIIPFTCSTVSLVLLWMLVESCAGSAAASLCALIFAALPMQLYYGQMVNFEPCVLMWLLLGLLGLRHWERTGIRRWGGAMLLGFGMAMMTAWVGYLLVLVFCGYFLLFERARHGRLAGVLLGMAVLCTALFFGQICLIQADVLHDLERAFLFRFKMQGGNYHVLSFSEWARAVGRYSLELFPVPFWLLAGAGTVHVLRRRREEEGMRWLGWAAACVFVMNLSYIVVFPNASFIHSYAAFFFVLPVAVLGGLGVLGLAEKLERASHRHMPATALTGMLLLLVGVIGCLSAKAAQKQARLLDISVPEPCNLIPALGRVIQAEFPEDTEVYVNFDPYYTPQLSYYAQRTVSNGMLAEDDWRQTIAETTEDTYGGVIWLGGPEAKGILSQLKTGTKRTVQVEGIPFCIWKH